MERIPMSRIALSTPAVQAETLKLLQSGDQRRYDYLFGLKTKAANFPGAYVLKIIWDDPDEYPEHALGYEQYTIRPYRLGYGCDGTTDQNIHLIAATVLNRIGINYGQAYVEAYPDEFNDNNRQAGIDDMNNCSGQQIVAETVIPEDNNLRTIQAILHDLNEINNRSLVGRLEELLLEKGFHDDVQRWYLIDFKAAS
ncbi:conserved protein of unknown function [Acidithiobacillus ferrivorans]|uniref:Uncharacterized protein n=1 Tax=Acidithiobacillus ferrivorans TaxID=160808 RepID=A0A060URJ0_9PROT|nr:hypothetical protein [Acidithiobacillus ferrivorans]CDQ09189.1 conserved hypothetical protein [Acidithiobacillus ferrivorans]SMH64858.1 conserved protein of unknown function [Acidithiobacillus ferrivorans]